MTKNKIKTGTGIILAVFAAMYSALCAVANYFAFVLCGETDELGVPGNTLRIAAAVMIIAALSFIAFTVCWNIKAHKGWGENTSTKMFRWVCINALVMFWIPPALTWNATNMFSNGLAFMAFTPVLAPVVLMIAAAVLMLDIIKDKNGGTLRKRR